MFLLSLLIRLHQTPDQHLRAEIWMVRKATMLLAFAVLFCEAWGYRDAATLTHESVMRYSNLDAHWLRSLCHVVYSPIRVVMETWYRSMWYWRRVHMLLADSWNGFILEWRRDKIVEDLKGLNATPGWRLSLQVQSISLSEPVQGALLVHGPRCRCGCAD